MQINDCIVTALGPGQINDLLLAFYQANGATSNQMNDAEVEFLSAQGVVVTDHLNDMWFRFLRGSGYYGSMNDMMYQFWCIDGGSTTDYALNIDFTTEPVVDKVSGMPMDATALAALLAGRPKDMTSGELAIAGEATLNSQGLLTYGGYTNLLIYSEDISQVAWDKIGSPVITGTDQFQAILVNSRVQRQMVTVEGVSYTISFRAKVAPGNKTTGCYMYHFNSASGSSTSLALTETLTTFSATVLGRIGGGNVAVGFQDNNSADWPLVTITDFQVTETTSVMPYVKTEATAVVVPNNYSDTGIGYQWDMGVGGAIMPDLWAALAGTPAQGELQIEWTPQFDYAQTTGDNCIVGIDAGERFVYHRDLGRVGTYDGSVYMSSPECFYAAETVYRIYVAWGTHPVDGANKRQIGITDGTTNWVSLIEDFDGSFDPVQFFRIATQNGYPQILHSVKLLKTPVSGTWSDEPVVPEVPSGYDFTWSIDPITVSPASVDVTGAEVGADYVLTVSGTGGADIVESGTVATASFNIPGIDVSGFDNGTLNGSLVLTNVTGAGVAVDHTVVKDIAVPTELMVANSDFLDVSWTGYGMSIRNGTSVISDVENGRVTQIVLNTDPAKTYIFKVRAQFGDAPVNITGLEFYHGGSLSGDASVLPMTSQDITYEVEILGSSGSLEVGIRDTNIADHGILGAREWSLMEKV